MLATQYVLYKWCQGKCTLNPVTMTTITTYKHVTTAMHINRVTCSTVVVHVGDWYPGEPHLVHCSLALGGGSKHIANVLAEEGSSWCHVSTMLHSTACQGRRAVPYRSYSRMCTLCMPWGAFRGAWGHSSLSPCYILTPPPLPLPPPWKG